MPRNVFIALLVVAAIAAALLRLSNLDRVLWKDEAITVLRASGYSERDYERAFWDGRIHTVAQMRTYQGRGSDQPASGVVRSLAMEDPQHPPLYYLLLRAWQRTAGGTPATQRLLSALLGIAAIPAMYWMCLELFRSRRTALVGAALFATSPFFFAYSHQLREYVLMVLFTLVSSTLLMRAAASRSAVLWCAYAASAIAGLYSDLFFAFAFAAHVLYVAFALPRASLRAASVAFLAVAAAFAPWLWNLATNTAGHKNDAGLWTAGAWPLAMLAEKWTFNAGTAFFDLEYRRVALAVFLVPVLATAAYAVWFVIRSGGASVRVFTIALLAPPAVSFALTDLLFHAHRSAVTRYGTLFYLGLLIAMTALLGAKSKEHAPGGGFWRAATLAVLAGGFISCAVSARQATWWDNYEDAAVIPVASQINAHAQPLVVALGPSWHLLYTLSFRLHDDVRVVMPVSFGDTIPKTHARTQFFVSTQEDEFLYRRASGRAAVQLQPAYTGDQGALWRSFHSPLHRGAATLDDSQLAMWRIVIADPR